MGRQAIRGQVGRAGERTGNSVRSPREVPSSGQIEGASYSIDVLYKGPCPLEGTPLDSGRPARRGHNRALARLEPSQRRSTYNLP